VARTFPTHKHVGVGIEGQEFENFSKKMLFSLLRVVKQQISPLFASRRKAFGKKH